MNYQFNSYVNRKEVETLKEMIFQRARERANSMMGDVQQDVMSIARESFVSNNNPFSQILDQTAEAQQPREEVVSPNEVKASALHDFVEAAEAQAEEVGFPKKNFFAGVNQNRVIQEQASARQIQNNMIEAREGLSNKKSFMGALEFLNSQAAVSLLNRRSKGVDIVA